jgi:TonB family protein
MGRFVPRFVVFVIILLAGAVFAQDNASSAPSSSQESADQTQPSATPPSVPDALLKICGPKNPRPCVTAPPRALSDPPPKYSKEAQKKRIEGTVVLIVIVGAKGAPTDVRVARSLGYGLDEEAIKAVKKWKFKPALSDSQPVAVRIQVVVKFQL